jgi:exosortase A
MGEANMTTATSPAESPATISAVPPAPTFSWPKACFTLLVAVLGLGVIYRETLFGMVSIWWRSETFTHAFLVAPISLWLIWEKRGELARYQPQPSLWLALPLAVLAFIWLLGALAAVNAVTQLAWVLMLILTVPVIIGLPAARQITFPLLFLLFAVPIGEFVMPKFMEWTATMTVLGLRASGVPVYQEGLQFVIPSGHWSVVQACSGVRYLIASFTVGTLFAYLNYRSTMRRVVFVVISLLVPIVANWVRAYIIVMLGHLSGNEIATGADHLIYGWVFFGVVIMIMFAIGMRWREDLTGKAGHETEMARKANPEFTQAEFAATRLARQRAQRVGSFGLTALILSIALLPFGALKLLDAQNSQAVPVLGMQALAVDGWTEEKAALASWQPAFANPSAIGVSAFRQGRQQVGVQIFYYRHQGYDRKLISSENRLVTPDDSHWFQLEQRAQQVLLAGRPLDIKSAVLQQQGGLAGTPAKLRVWQWYWIDDHWVGSDSFGKLWLALARLRGHGDDAAALFIYAPEDDVGGAEAVLTRFLTAAQPALTGMLEKTRRAQWTGMVAPVALLDPLLL